MKKLKIFLLLSILLCFGFVLSSEVHAQGDGPKVFEEGDVLPATTQLRISWVDDILNIPANSHIFTVGDPYSLIGISGSINIKLVGDNWITIYDSNIGDFISPYTNYDGDHPYCDIDTSTWNIDKRTISTISDGMDIFRWEDLNGPQGFNITFEENGGTSVTDLSGQTTLPNPLPIPTKENHTFLGWYYNSAFTQIANAGDIIENDVTLYAKWELNAYKAFEVGDVLPAGNIKISWDFTGYPMAVDGDFLISSDGDFSIRIWEFDNITLFINDEMFYADTPGYTIITLTEAVTITDMDGYDDYYEYIHGALFWEVVSQDYLDGFMEARELYGFDMGGYWISGEQAWNNGYDLGSELAWEEGFEYGMDIYGYYDPITDQWLSVSGYLELYGTDKPGQSDFYNNFDKYFIPAMIIVFGGAIVLTILKVFKGREQ